MKQCVDCTFYLNTYSSARHGVCRKNAPVIIDESMEGKWPRIFDGDFCGDFRMEGEGEKATEEAQE